MSERGKKHPIAHLVRGYNVVGVESEWEEDLPFIVLRLSPGGTHILMLSNGLAGDGEDCAGSSLSPARQTGCGMHGR
jgi:hypothetical protein